MADCISAVGDVVPQLSSQPGTEWVHNPHQTTDNGAAQAALLQCGCNWTGLCTSTAHVDFAHQQPTASPPHLSAPPPPAWGERAQDVMAAWFPQPGFGNGLLPSQSANSHVGSQVGPYRHHQASRSVQMARAQTPCGKAAALMKNHRHERAGLACQDLRPASGQVCPEDVKGCSPMGRPTTIMQCYSLSKFMDIISGSPRGCRA
ncbi:hypothetical protein C2E23DRAFT_376131 [Lenzites betulinus]|nr:hypothetical protein C2E23DRAFT_376131 [Lenzites betulinus]